MNKEQNKKRNSIIVAIVIFVFATLINKVVYHNSWILSIVTGIITLIILFLLVKFKIIKLKSKEQRDKEKAEISKIKTEQLKELIEKSKEYEKEYSKRKDRGLKAKICEEINDLVSYGLIIFILGLFVLGAIPSYFNVNDEYYNPTNTNISFEKSLDMLHNITKVELMDKVHNIGKDNPRVFFWLFWIAVAYLMIYPIVKIIYYTIKLIKNKEEKNGYK